LLSPAPSSDECLLITNAHFDYLQRLPLLPRKCRGLPRDRKKQCRLLCMRKIRSVTKSPQVRVTLTLCSADAFTGNSVLNESRAKPDSRSPDHSTLARLLLQSSNCTHDRDCSQGRAAQNEHNASRARCSEARQQSNRSFSQQRYSQALTVAEETIRKSNHADADCSNQNSTDDPEKLTFAQGTPPAFGGFPDTAMYWACKTPRRCGHRPLQRESASNAALKDIAVPRGSLPAYPAEDLDTTFGGIGSFVDVWLECARRIRIEPYPISSPTP
jgi:hypothetical protein